MKYKLLIETVNELLGLKKTNKKDRKQLKKTLKNLKEKEKELKQKYKIESDDAQKQELRNKIKILHKQRQKGLSLLKEMQKD